MMTIMRMLKDGDRNDDDADDDDDDDDDDNDDDDDDDCENDDCSDDDVDDNNNDDWDDDDDCNDVDVDDDDDIDCKGHSSWPHASGFTNPGKRTGRGYLSSTTVRYLKLSKPAYGIYICTYIYILRYFE